MKKLVMLGVVVALVASAGAAMAYPSLLGPTGGANLPTAKVVKQGTLGFAYDFFANGMDIGGGVSLDDTSAFRLLYGLGKGAEVGFTYNMQDASFAGSETAVSDANLNNWGLNAKYNFAQEGAAFEPAAGVVYQNYSDADATVTQLYLVGSKLFKAAEGGTSFRGSLGVNWTNADFGDGDSTDAFRPYINLDLGFSSGMTLTGEYQFKNDDLDNKALMSLVLRYPLSNGFAVQLGTSNAFRGVSGGPDQNLMFGINWNYDANLGAE